MSGFVDRPNDNPALVAANYTRPDAVTVTPLPFRGFWQQGTVYNQNDLVRYLGDGNLLLIAIKRHVSGDTIDQENWGTIVNFDDLGSSDETLPDRVATIEQKFEDGAFGDISGNNSTIIIRQYTAAEIAALDIKIPPSGEFWLQTDSSPRVLVLGNGEDEFDELDNIFLVDAGDIGELVTLAQAAQVSAEAAAEQSILNANAAPGVDIGGGLQSARATALEVQEMLRVLAGFPSKILGTGETAYTLVKSEGDVIGDEFREILCKNSGTLTITIPLDWNKTAAVDGSPGVISCRIWRLGSTVNIAGASGGIPTVGSAGPWQRSYRFTADPPVGTPAALTQKISVPAGIGRVIILLIAELNFSTTTHNVTVASDVGTVDLIGGPTSQAGNFSSTNPINGRIYKVTLPDSAEDATEVNLTYTLPATPYCAGVKLRSFSNVDSVTNIVADNVAASLAPEITIDGDVNGSVCFGGVAIQGRPTPINNIAGLDTVDANFVSGGTKLKDMTFVSGIVLAPVAGNKLIDMDITTDDPPNGKKYIRLGVSINPAASGPTDIDITGSTAVVADKYCDIQMLSDGRTVLLAHGG